MRVGVTLVAFCLVASGCLGVVTQETFEFESSPAAIDDGSLADAGYEPSASRAITVNRSFEIQGQERRVNLTNHVRTYRKPTAGVPLAHAVAFSTPSASVLGQSVNPLARVDERQLVELALEDVAQVRDVTRVDNRSVTVLGSETTVEKFAARAERNGSSARVFVHATRLTNEGDLLVLVVMYPRSMEDGDSDVVTLLRGVEHPADGE